MFEDQLRQMEADRRKLVERLRTAKTNFEILELHAAIKAHDAQAAKLTGVDVGKMVERIKERKTK